MLNLIKFNLKQEIISKLVNEECKTHIVSLVSQFLSSQAQDPHLKDTIHGCRSLTLYHQHIHLPYNVR